MMDCPLKMMDSTGAGRCFSLKFDDFAEKHGVDNVAHHKALKGDLGRLAECVDVARRQAKSQQLRTRCITMLCLYCFVLFSYCFVLFLC